MATQAEDRSTERTTSTPGRGYTMVGFVLAVAALVIVPIILGPAAAIFGGVGHAKGDPVGKWAIGAGIVATLAGMALGAWVMTNV